MSEPRYSPDPPELVPVFVTNAVRTSAGAGPGLRMLPPQEANAIVRARHGVIGTRPPDGYPNPAETTRDGIARPDGSPAEVPR